PPGPTPFPYTPLFRSNNPLGCDNGLTSAASATDRAPLSSCLARRPPPPPFPQGRPRRETGQAQAMESLYWYCRRLYLGEPPVDRSEEHTSELQSRENL